MSAFIENVNKYLKVNGIRQKFLSIRSGMSEDKISKLLNGKKKINEAEMDSISKALGKSVNFFLDDSFIARNAAGNGRLAFYAGEPGEDQMKVAYELVEFIENMDEVLNSSSWYLAAGSDLDAI